MNNLWLLYIQIQLHLTSEQLFLTIRQCYDDVILRLKQKTKHTYLAHGTVVRVPHHEDSGCWRKEVV